MKAKITIKHPTTNEPLTSSEENLPDGWNEELISNYPGLFNGIIDTLITNICLEFFEFEVEVSDG